jgi:hypothetical protein
MLYVEIDMTKAGGDDRKKIPHLLSVHDLFTVSQGKKLILSSKDDLL